MMIDVCFEAKWPFRIVNRDRPTERFYLPLTNMLIA